MNIYGISVFINMYKNAHNPINYIKLNGNLWRVVDETVKIFSGYI